MLLLYYGNKSDKIFSVHDYNMHDYVYGMVNVNKLFAVEFMHLKL